MNPTGRPWHPRYGIEFDWLAVDEDGAVAVFTTSGHGRLPQAVRDAIDELDRMIDDIDQWTVIGGSVESPADAGATWRVPAQRGLFAFDWHLWHGPYVRVARPTVVLPMADLPSVEAGRLASRVRLPVRFSVATTVVSQASGSPWQRPKGDVVRS